MKRNARFLGLAFVFGVLATANSVIAAGLTTPIVSLPYPFDASKTYAQGYRSPTCAAISNPTGQQQQAINDINSAFALAPSSFQTQLNNLKCIFIYSCASAPCSAPEMADPSTASFGWRERADQISSGNAGSEFVAISLGLWSVPQSGSSTLLLPTLDVYENGILAALLNWTSANPPTFASGVITNRIYTVLAALAHEYGHVLWYDTFRPKVGGAYDFTTFCDGRFYTDSWKDVEPPPKWREFGQVQGEHKIYDVQTADVLNAMNQGNLTTQHGAGDLIYRVYDTAGPWASLFASFSPDEDFVETFKFRTLVNATTPVTSLPITITGSASHQADVFSDQAAGRKPILKLKTDCFPG
jgi:hypothetical protein